MTDVVVNVRALNEASGQDAAAASDSAELSQAWAEGTEPGGTGTKSAQEHAADAGTQATAAATSAAQAADSAVEAALYDPSVRFKTVADMLASNRAGKGAGTIWQAGTFLYEEVTSGEHLTTAGGVKLRVLPGADGAYHSAAFGVVGPGNETTALTAALAASENGTLVIDRPSLGSFISDCLIPGANTKIIIASGTSFNVIGSGSRALQIQQENVHVFGYGAKIVMDGTQSSHAVYFNSGNTNIAENCTLHGIDIVGSGNSGDDCIYVGGDPSKDILSLNIRLYDVTAKGNAFTRNGLSLVAVDGFYAQNCKFSNGGGSAGPGAAVDIEANNWMTDGSSPCKNWHFKNCDFHDSDGGGFIAIYGSDGVVEDCMSYGNGSSGYVCNAGGRNFEDDNYRLGDRLAVSAISEPDGWITVSTGTAGTDLLITDLGIAPGMVVNRKLVAGKTWPTEIQASVRWVIAEIDETETKIRLASGYIYDKKVSLSGGSYAGLTTDPTTSALHLLVYGREGNLTDIQFIRCKGYNNMLNGSPAPDYNIGLCGNVTLADCETLVPNLLNAQAVNFSYSYKTKIKGGKFLPAVFGSPTKGISGDSSGPFEISGVYLKGHGNFGILASGMTHSFLRDCTVIDCGLVSGGSSNYPVHIQLSDGGKLDNVHVINSDAHRANLGVGIRVNLNASDLVIEDCSGTSHPIDTGVQIQGPGTVVRNVLDNGERVSELASSTTASLGDAAHAINTVGKYAGKLVKDTTTVPDRLLVATDSTPTSIWLALDGTATVTPS